MKLAKYLFYLSVLLFPLGLIASFKLTGFSDVRIVFLDILVGLIVLAWYSRCFEKRVLEVLGFSGVSLISLLVAIPKYELSQIGVGGLYLARFTAYTGLIFVLRKLKLKLDGVLIYIGVITATLGLFQYWLYPNLRNLKYLGWDPHLNRLFGTFFDPQFIGIILVLTLILLVSRKNILGWKKAIYIGITGMALVLTFSRSSYLACIIGFVILVFGAKINKFKLAVTALVITIMIVIINPGGTGGDLLRRDTVNSRIGSWSQAIEVFKSSPVFGVGFNMYRYAGIIKGLAFNNAGAGVDNSFLFVLATTGVVGLFAYFVFWKGLLLKANAEALAITGALFTHGMFNNTLFYPWILWWIAVYFSSSRESS